MDPTRMQPFLFALGALAPDEGAAIAERRLRDAALDHEITQWEERLAPLALAVPPRAPSLALWERIDAALDARVAADAPLRVARFHDTDWEPWSDGLEMKTLTRALDGTPESLLLRMEPGAAIPEHFHDRIEECLIVHGDLIHAGETLGPGDFTIAPRGGTHAPMTTHTGGLLYVRYLPA